MLHEAAGSGSAREVGRRHGITETTFDRWRAKYGEARRLKALEEENRRRLRRLVADLPLEDAILKDVVRREW